jgi:hypothetical protein
VRRHLPGRGLVAAIAAIAVTALLAPVSAGAITYAPVNRPGPALSVSQERLNASLHCSGDLATGPTPVLLVPGTGSDPEHNFSWNYEPALTSLGISWCAVTLPDHALGDVQVAGEYVVNGIRTMYARAGRRISIIGHSQGGMVPRWPLRFWPDTRTMVDDQIGFAPSNHGTTGAETICSSSCAAADWQQSDKSQFIKALNSYKETFAGISYTEIYSHNDEIVTPNSDDTGSSSLHTGDGQITNEAIQQLCPADPSEHLAIGTQDNVAYELAIDALTHPGPANPARVAMDPNLCSTMFMPGINPATYPADLASAGSDLAANTAAAKQINAEPPLRCYVTASCGLSKCKKTKRKKHKHHAAAARKHKKKHRHCRKRRKKHHKHR